eukprot:gnl/MRDRNA2_/MRDRNA2_96886_c0_seq1.p1 gnl/MRDRNA2_/MRDRNA2_96886_c0~~gnl/MRDRNA2_/MRDRNA2_96886_c0_seq1.p1  ORF type:complete len:780 (-),score=170.16 gnl/MRDRNA2_/MRDRNA2_96886_c0_seq1:616-2955(-)
MLKLVILSLTALRCSANPVITLDDLDGDSFSASHAHAGTYAPCLKDAYKGQFVHDWARNKGLSSARFSFDPPKDGCYLVEEYHPGGDEACSRYLPKNVQLQIGYCNNKTEEVVVDQGRNGGQWNILGKWPFYKGMPGYFKLSNSAQDSCSMDQCFWVADAFRVTWLGDDCRTASLNPPLVLDDSAAQIRTGKAWKSGAAVCAKAGHDGGFHITDGVHDAEASASWNFSVSKDGCYWVEEYHPDTSACDLKLSSQVPVQIDFCKGLHTDLVIDQSQGGGQWNKLVRLPFYASRPAAVQISAKGLNIAPNGVWAADAFRLTWDAESCRTEETGQDEGFVPLAEPEAEQLKDQNQVVFLPARVDDTEAKIHALTSQTLWQCPATAGKTFHHDGLQKDEVSAATYYFYPPRDGCYLIEEMHPPLEQCKASANTYVHVRYCKGLQASGTVNQTANPGQWTFLAALPFYAGRVGSVMLSNWHTDPDTLTLFDQVRFTWSGKSCSHTVAHPRKAELRMTVDFKNVANRLVQFGSALTAKLVALAGVPEEALRLTDLRSGSIIAEFLVLPSVAADPLAPGLSIAETMLKLQEVVVNNAADLCALSGASVSECAVEFKELGVARPSVWPVPEQRPGGSRDQNRQEEEQAEEGSDMKIFALCAVSLGLLGLFVVGLFGVKRYSRYKYAKSAQTAIGCSEPPVKEAFAATLSDEAASMEEGKASDFTKPVEDDDNNSTLAPSSDKQSEPDKLSDKQSEPGEQNEPSSKGDIQDGAKPVLSVVRALSDQSI